MLILSYVKVYLKEVIMNMDVLSNAACENILMAETVTSSIGSIIGKFGQDSFIQGANWRINTVWHFNDKVPDEGFDILCALKESYCVVCGYTKETWKSFVEEDGCIRWAYIRDLLPSLK